MPTPAASNAREYTVSEIAGALKRVVEDTFGYVRVRGEISGFKLASSGHAYLCLKDETAVMDGVCWKGSCAKLSFKPEDGLEVICTGRLTTYPGRSKYQIVIEHMEPAGVGALMALLEKRKKQFEAEGLFAQERKTALPYLPGVIGVVTSPTGAVIRDILHRLSDRFPVHVLVWGVAVQGEGAAAQVAAAIQGFNALQGALRPDLLIVARGGGSLEDLWAFNEEIVVRAAFASAIPLISAVGHETDTTLIDYVSDRRAPTPTAAAEIAVPVRSELLAMLMEHGSRMTACTLKHIEHKEERARGLARGLPPLPSLLGIAAQKLDDRTERLLAALPASLAVKAQRLAVVAASLRPNVLLKEIAQCNQAADDFAGRLRQAVARLFTQHEKHLLQLAQLLSHLDYREVLKRGFALVRGEGGALVTAAAQVSAGQALTLVFHDGERAAKAEGVAAKPKAKGKTGTDQGALF